MPTEPQQQAGPFDPYLNPSPASQAYVSSARPQDNSGYQGKAGNSALIVDKFLEGMSHGRMLAFQRSEQENSQRLGLIKQKISEVQQANLPDATKQQLIGQLNQTFAQMVYHQIPEDDKKKGGKGSAQGGGDQPVDAGTHIRNALKGIVGGLIGPGAQKENISHEDLGKALSGVDTILRDPNQSLTAQAGQAGTAFNQAFDALVKKNGGKIPTTGELMQDPASFKAYQQGFSLSGKPTPEMEAILKATDQEAAKRAKIEEESSKQAAESARARENRESIEKVAEIQAGGRHEDVMQREAGEDRRAAARLQADAPLRAAQTAHARAAANLDYLKAKTAKQESATGAGNPNNPYLTSERVAAVQSSKPDEKGRYPVAMQGVPEDIQSLVKQLVEYKIPISQYALGRTGGKEANSPMLKAIELAPLYDPSFDASNYNVRLKLKQGFTSGKEATNIRSLNTAISHLQTFSNAAKALNNTSYPGWNSIANMALKAGGDPRFKTFAEAATAIESELATAFKGSGAATNQEITEWRKNLHDADSPQALQAAADTAVELMGGRLNELQDQYTNGMGRPKDFHFLNDRSRQILKKMGKDPDTMDQVMSGGAAAPSGAPPQGAAPGRTPPPAGQQGQGPPRQFKTADEYLKSLQK